MNAGVTMDARALFTSLDAFPKLLGVTAPQAMRRSMLRLIQRVIAWTPPTTGRGASSGASALKAGEAAIRRDILKIMFLEKREVLDFWQKANGGAPFISSLTLNRKGSSQKYTLGNVLIDPDGHDLAALHTAARNSRGRIPKRYRGKRIATTPEAFSRFLGRQQSHSGIARSGWVPALAHFGGQSPAWIARHGGNNGSFVDSITSTLFTLEAVNRAKSIGSLQERLITSSIRAEARATLRELERAMGDAAYRAKLTNKISIS